MTEVTDAVRLVLADSSYFSERLSRALMTQPARGMNASNGMHLTARELQVFSHIGEGLTVSGTTAKIGVSVKTVVARRDNIKTSPACKPPPKSATPPSAGSMTPPGHLSF